MQLAELDHAGIARTLTQIADRRRDLADAFFERLEVIELPPDEHPGIRVWRESGVAVRLVRDERTWLATRDGISRETFSGAARRVARALPRTSYPEPRFPPEAWPEPPEASEVQEFPATLLRALRAHHVKLPCRLTVRRHRRWVRVIGTQLASGVEHESFYSVEAATPEGRFGGLLTELDERAAEGLGSQLVHAWRARDAAPPKPGKTIVLLAPAATAVLLHEAVAHALETDTLELGGHPEAAIGVELGAAALDVFDDPASAPEGVRRQSDDEGHPVARRCLLRGGKVEQPLADGAWARRSEMLRAGAGRRPHRHLPPAPRSSHLELMPGTASREELMSTAEGGLFFTEAERGSLDPRTGELVLYFPFGFRVRDRAPGPLVGPATLRGHVTDVLKAVAAVGHDPVAAGAGWCAKGGLKLPVWATAPDLLLAEVEIAP